MVKLSSRAWVLAPAGSSYGIRQPVCPAAVRLIFRVLVSTMIGAATENTCIYRTRTRPLGSSTLLPAKWSARSRLMPNPKSYVIGVSPDEKWCADTGQGNVIVLRNAQTGANTRAFKGLDEATQALVFSPDASRLVGTDQGGMIKMWNVPNGDELAAASFSRTWINGVLFSPDGKRLAVVGHLTKSRTGDVRILDAETFREIWSLKGHTLNVTDAAFSPDGQRLATSSVDRTVRIWDLTAGQEILKLRGEQIMFRLRFVSNHRLLGASTDLTIRVWDGAALPGE